MGLLVTASGDLHIFFNGVSGQKIATGMPINKCLWGVVDVCYSCSKITSEMLSCELDGVSVWMFICGVLL